jgi:CO/xanthine dehydrogenase FAD-binding subunit
MAIAHQFAYLKPRTVSEAIKTLARYGNRALVLAGGTDIIPLIADDVLHPQALVDIKGIPRLNAIEFRNEVLTIGALATFSDLRDSAVVAQKYPVFREMAGWVASTAIRNRATMVGNICSAVPCCDSGPVLMVYEASVLLAGPAGKRKLPLREWFLGPRKTALKKGEIVTGIAVRLPRKKHAGCFVKLGRYRGEDLAQASVTVLALADHQYRVAFGSVAPAPVRGHRIEALLAGKALTDSLLAEAVKLVPQEIAPITDIRASKEYRAHMCGVMLERGMKAAVSRLRDAGPAYGTRLG